MKTIYMKPELKVVIINNPCLLNNASIPEGKEYKGTTVLSKGGGNYWDDEEPEEVDW